MGNLIDRTWYGLWQKFQGFYRSSCMLLMWMLKNMPNLDSLRDMIYIWQKCSTIKFPTWQFLLTIPPTWRKCKTAEGICKAIWMYSTYKLDKNVVQYSTAQILKITYGKGAAAHKVWIESNYTPNLRTGMVEPKSLLHFPDGQNFRPCRKCCSLRAWGHQ